MAILQAVKEYAIAVGILKLERGVKELNLELKEETGESELELNERMKWLGPYSEAMLVFLVGVVGIVCYTEIISPSSLY